MTPKHICEILPSPNQVLYCTYMYKEGPCQFITWLATAQWMRAWSLDVDGIQRARCLLAASSSLGRHYTSLNGGQICVQSQDEIDGIHRSFSKTYRCSTLQLFIFCIVLEPEALHDLHKWRRNSMGARTHGAISEEKWLSASQKLQLKGEKMNEKLYDVV